MSVGGYAKQIEPQDEKGMGLRDKWSPEKSGSHYTENSVMVTECHVITTIKCHIIMVFKQRNDSTVDIIS